MSDSMNETPHLTALRRQDEIRRQQKDKFRVVDGVAELYQAALPANDLETVIAAAAVAEQRLREEMMLASLQTGGRIKDKGIYLGTWEPKDSEGQGLGKIFNVFAAPTDLADENGRKKTYQYIGAFKRVTDLKNWHGHDGETYTDAEHLFTDLKTGAYKGGWIIPPRELLDGKDRNGKVVQPDNLYVHRNKGAFAGTFDTENISSVEGDNWYWSSSQNRYNVSQVGATRFSDGHRDWHYGGRVQLSVRPIRLEPRS